MRPERLELEGFTAFRERVEVDFSDADLCAFWGPTGAGKSSVIDAIIFVLYGIVPRYDDRRRVGPVISQGRTEARVRLDFRVGGRRFSAVRVVRATATGATTKEARLERRLEDGTSEVLAGSADELTDAVTSLLGLTYEHFTTCVVLPQGSFARFLHHAPRDRQALLVELLDLGVYERMAAMARERASRARDVRDLLANRLAELADATPARRDELSGRLDALARTRDVVADALVELEALAARTADAQARADSARHRHALARGVAAPAQAARLARDIEDSRDAVTAASGTLAQTETDLSAAEAAVAALPPAPEVRAAVQRHAELADQRQLVGKGQRATDAATAAASGADAALSSADAALSAAQDAFEAARLADLAAALSEGLGPGDPCPVCGQPIELLARTDGAGEQALADARRRLERVGKAQRDAASAAQAAAVELARVKARLERETARLVELESELSGGPSEEALAATLAAIAAAEAETELRRASRTAARQALAAAQARAEAASVAAEAAWTAFDAARDQLGASLGASPPRPNRNDLAEAWSGLCDWAADRVPALGEEVAAAEADLVAADRARGALSDRLRGVAVGVGADASLSPASVRAAWDGVVRQHAAVEAELGQLAADLARVAKLTEELAAATETESVAALLARHLAANGFQKWVLESAMERLVEGATVLLDRLSGGAYSLTLEPKSSNFAVIDHLNADTVRSARTLSGGETFLTSLALALALADQVVELAGATSSPLESLFLDEGFGTLDPDTLDTVASAIEELGNQGRMVALVSHVRDLAERLPVRFEVQKGPAGATITKVIA